MNLIRDFRLEQSRICSLPSSFNVMENEIDNARGNWLRILDIQQKSSSFILFVPKVEVQDYLVVDNFFTVAINCIYYKRYY